MCRVSRVRSRHFGRPNPNIATGYAGNRSAEHLGRGRASLIDRIAHKLSSGPACPSRRGPRVPGPSPRQGPVRDQRREHGGFCQSLTGSRARASRRSAGCGRHLGTFAECRVSRIRSRHLGRPTPRIAEGYAGNRSADRYLGPGRGGVRTLASIIPGAPPLRARVTRVTRSPSQCRDLRVQLLIGQL
jgi:hypothetical protein